MLCKTPNFDLVMIGWVGIVSYYNSGNNGKGGAGLMLWDWWPMLCQTKLDFLGYRRKGCFVKQRLFCANILKDVPCYSSY